MTVKAMWLGGEGEADTCEWKGVVFKKGEAVELADPFMIRKAKTNPFFAVEGEKPEPSTQADRLALARAAKAAKAAKAAM